MRDTKEIRSGMRDEITLSGPGYAVFHGRDAGCFETDGGIDDHKNHLTEKTPNNDHLYERNNNLCISGLLVTYNQCVLVLDPLALGPVTITPYKERLAWRACLSKVTKLQSLLTYIASKLYYRDMGARSFPEGVH